MSLSEQFSVTGFLVRLLLTGTLWAACAVIGRLLLPRLGKDLPRVELLAVTAPWGFLFISGTVAAFYSGGRSMLTPVPLLQAVLAAFLYRPRRERPSAQRIQTEPSPDLQSRGGHARPHLWLLAGGCLLLLAGLQLGLWMAYMPYRGNGSWTLPHADYGSCSTWGRELVAVGVESMSAPTILATTEQGRPQLHLYHYFELWFTGAVANWFSLNSLLVLLFVVYPLGFAMQSIGCAALVGMFVPDQPWAKIAAIGCLVASTWPGELFGFGIPLVWNPHANIYYCNNIVAFLLSITSFIHLMRRRVVLAAGSLAFATSAAQPMLAVVLPGLVVFGLWGIWDHHKASRRLDAAGMALLAAALAAVLFLWALATGHSLTPVLPSPPVSIWRRAASTSVHGLILLYGSLLLGLPFLWGLLRLWSEHKSSSFLDSTRGVVALCLSVWFVSFYVYAALGGRANTRGDVIHAPLTMWSGFILPIGYIGLLVWGAKGPFRLGAAFVVMLVLLFGTLSAAVRFRSELTSQYFRVRDLDELRSICHGQTIGYFSKGHRVWWVPDQGCWAALSDCKMVRLNRVQADDAMPGFWESSALAAYARAQGSEWKNDPITILGFTRAHDIHLVAGWPECPVPPDFLRHCVRLRKVGDFVIYRISSPTSHSRLP